MKDVLDLTKIRLVYFVLVSAIAGYALGNSVERPFEIVHFLEFLIGLCSITMGSFALNQVQEVALDSAMPRTKNRPIAAGRMKKTVGLAWGLGLCLLGSALLWVMSPVVCFLGILTILLYNGLYTMLWKPRWTFGAVPGAIPGAMPVVMGYASFHDAFWTLECAYAFLIMFFWQMPHFWALAMRYKEDYASGGVPVMPHMLGNEKALMHIMVYMIPYICLAVLSPLFVSVIYYFYWLLVVPFAFMLAFEFYRFNKSNGEKHWLSFFLWTNFSMLVFLLAPVGDKFLFLYLKT